MESDTPPGTYTFSVDVKDEKRNENAVGSVTVNVYNLPEVAFNNQAAIRISMDTIEYEDPSAFLMEKSNGVSPKDAFVSLLKSKLSDEMGLRNEPIIDVFSIKSSLYDSTIDVRFTVMHGNTYLSKTTIEGVIATNLVDFERTIGGYIKATSIDMCQVKINFVHNLIKVKFFRLLVVTMDVELFILPTM